ncbi:MAG TPA: hypothetical protein VJ898_03830 [Natrialbaceae archaeon]|nr:hypothetical protein [Natrialbaceae archaeon]
MTRGRRLSLILALLAALALVTSTGGYTSMTAGRNVEVAVAPDHAAFLGFEQTTDTVTNGTANVTVTVTNRFPTGTALETVVVIVDGETATLAADGTLDAGESASATCEDVACGAPIAVHASGSDVSVSLYRSVRC